MKQLIIEFYLHLILIIKTLVKKLIFGNENHLFNLIKIIWLFHYPIKFHFYLKFYLFYFFYEIVF